MALDGIATANIVSELNDRLLGGRIDKIYQPLGDEIIFSARSIGANYKVLASANSSHPRIHLTQLSKDNPMSPPLFCMVLRKYIAGGKIVRISQPNFERIIIIEIESMNEMGDVTAKKLIIEIMGKHSNIILTDENDKILDAIKRVSHEKSSVREVLPGKTYVFPPSQNKSNPLLAELEPFLFLLHQQEGMKLQEFIYKNYTGISPVMASEICFRANLEPSLACEQVDDISGQNLFSAFSEVMQKTADNAFSPEIIYQPKTNKILDFSVIPMSQFKTFKQVAYPSISELLEAFYSEKDNAYHIQQKAHDMRRIILSNIERCVKKKEIQKKTLKDTDSKDLWKLKGELITSNIYAIPKDATSFTAVNFYEETMPEMKISLDPTKTPAENAQKYFNKYNKAKRTLEALKVQTKQNDDELNYLESILNGLENAKETADLEEVKTELTEAGFMKRRFSKKGKQQKPKATKPMHFISSNDFDIYVGKSNIQNDELTLRFAESKDIWLHTKDIPGSHVIIRTNGTGTAPDATLLEAANLAAFYSKAKTGSNVPVDYTLRKNVKKPNGAKPGMVIYEQNKTVYITPSEQETLDLKML